MKIKTFSYRNAEEILQHPKYKEAYDEIIKICKECPLPVYKDKSTKQASLDVLQQVLNVYFKLCFIELGWEEEAKATPDEKSDELRADFRKTFYDKGTGGKLVTVQIEVEFGNAASTYRNYFKYQLSFSFDKTDICVLIVASQKLSTRIDSGVANFEKAVREIPSAKLSVTVPILVIGLFDEGHNEWNMEETTNLVDIFKSENGECKTLCTKIVQSYIDKINGKVSEVLKITKEDEDRICDILSGKSELIDKLNKKIIKKEQSIIKIKEKRKLVKKQLESLEKEYEKLIYDYNNVKSTTTKNKIESIEKKRERLVKKSNDLNSEINTSSVNKKEFIKELNNIKTRKV